MIILVKKAKCCYVGLSVNKFFFFKSKYFLPQTDLLHHKEAQRKRGLVKYRILSLKRTWEKKKST